MGNAIGESLLADLGADHRAALDDLRRFLDVDDIAQAAYELVLGLRDAETITRAFVAWLEGEAGFGKRFRRSLEAVHEVLENAARVGTTDDPPELAELCPRIFRQPPRTLHHNGGDRRSESFQRCEKGLARGTTDYYLARLQRDRPDLLEAYRAGAYRSIRQAAIAAGYVKSRPGRREPIGKQ